MLVFSKDMLTIEMRVLNAETYDLFVDLKLDVAAYV